MIYHTHQLVQNLADGEGQGGLACCSPWGHKEPDTTGQLNSNMHIVDLQASQVVVVEKNLPTNAGDARDVGLSPGSGKSLGGGNGNPLQYFCLENLMNRGAWQLQFIGLQRVGLGLSLHTHPRPPPPPHTQLIYNILLVLGI